MHSNYDRTALLLYLFCRNMPNKNHRGLLSIYDSMYDLIWNLHILSFRRSPLKNTDEEHIFKLLRAFSSFIPSISHHNLTLPLSLFLFKPLSCVQPTLLWKPLPHGTLLVSWPLWKFQMIHICKNWNLTSTVIWGSKTALNILWKTHMETVLSKYINIQVTMLLLGATEKQIKISVSRRGHILLTHWPMRSHKLQTIKTIYNAIHYP